MGIVKIGIIGCGWFGNFHLDQLLKINEVEVAALASSNELKLNEMGKKIPDARLYSSHREMYEREKLDAVFICIPPYGHDDVEILAAQKGIHMYVEKPIELSMERARTIESAINQSGVISCVGYQERYTQEIEKIKSLIPNKQVGLVTARWIGGMPGAPWWKRKEQSGGQIVEQSTHLFDLLRYFFGEANTVFGMSGNGIIQNVPDYNIDDYSSTMISFQSGVIATVETACYLEDIKNFKGIGFRIVFNDLIIEYDWGKEFRYITKDSIQKVAFTEGSYLKATQVFIDAIRTGDRQFIKSSYSDALKTLALTLASNESMMNSKPISL
ncbi:MAG: Gfo/Idh/MocA family protein [Lachnotalea sp.]